MVLGHLLPAGDMRSIDFHLAVESVVEEKVVAHAYAVWLHGVALTIVVIANISVVVVGDSLPSRHLGVQTKSDDVTSPERI